MSALLSYCKYGTFYILVGYGLSNGCSFAQELPSDVLTALNAEDFRIRENAQEKLLSWSREYPHIAMDKLYRKSRSATEPETRERCNNVLRSLVNDEYLKEGEGFIGIHMQDEMKELPGDPKPRVSIRVMQVMPDSAGHRAGLLMNDLIVGLNDQVWRAGEAVRSFSESIREFKPGTKVILKVLRDKDLIDLQVILGRRPLIADNPFLNERPDDENAAEQAAKEAYFRRWMERRKLKD